MAEPHKQMLGVVIRKDGTVPFDEGVHPNVRAACLAYLAGEGHEVEPVHGTTHVRIKNWTPPSAA